MPVKRSRVSSEKSGSELFKLLAEIGWSTAELARRVNRPRQMINMQVWGDRSVSPWILVYVRKVAAALRKIQPEPPQRDTESKTEVAEIATT